MKASPQMLMMTTPFIILFCLSGCQTTEKQTNAASPGSTTGAIQDFVNVPKSIEVPAPYVSRDTFNQSFPEITYTSPAGTYILDEEKSGRNLYYRIDTPFKVKFDSGLEIKDETTKGHLVLSKKDLLKQAVKSSEVFFYLEHTESTLAWTKKHVSNNAYRTAGNNSTAALIAETTYNTERSFSNKQALKGIAFRPESNLHIGRGGTNRIRNGNKFTFSPKN